MAISTDLYRTFFSVGMYLSFSMAAKEIGVSQSAISQSIKQLESELEMKLFVRTTKSVSFTPEGKELFDAVAQAFAILDNGIVQLRERIHNQYESLQLAVPDTLCRHFLLPYLQRWKMASPKSGLHITNRPSPDCVDMVLQQEAQLAIVNHYDALLTNPQLEVIPLLTVQDCFVGGSTYRDVRTLDLQALLEEPLLLLSKGAASRTFFDDLTNGACHKPAFELGSLDVILDLVEINMGIALLPLMMVEEKINNGSVVMIDTTVSLPTRQIVLVRSRRTPLSQGAEDFINLLTKV